MGLGLRASGLLPCKALSYNRSVVSGSGSGTSYIIVLKSRQKDRKCGWEGRA